jgi:predicted fused transcriptional regulator/phosphomethylpyrimidine kinase
MIEPRCNVCKAIVAEYKKDGSSKLERRLLNCRKFNPRGPETQTDIGREYGFNVVSMSRHLKYHQNPKEEVAIQNKMDRNIEIKAKTYQTAQNIILDKGIEGIESGDIKLTANTVATVARDKMNQEEKNKDRQVKVLEMLYAFASGELKPGGDSLQSPSNYIEGAK